MYQVITYDDQYFEVEDEVFAEMENIKWYHWVLDSSFSLCPKQPITYDRVEEYVLGNNLMVNVNYRPVDEDKWKFVEREVTSTEVINEQDDKGKYTLVVSYQSDHTFEVVVSDKNSSKVKVIPAIYNPIWGVDAADFNNINAVAEELIKEIENGA